MQQLMKNYPEILRYLTVTVILAWTFGVGTSFAQGQSQSTTQATPSATPSDIAAEQAPLSREEILALFQREAKAAYQMHREACQGLPTDEQAVCLAKARLQFDEDMRYAQRRADQGY